ncbi:MAG: murein biosynthesis integral membrane protein MurJ [Bacteriovoracaceae bacterium]|nr:murein biosynthesis integral membrane protein MurJ [Bacteriovoracaceae bacterium]
MSTKNVLRSSLVMASATFCSRILGLVREQIMAAYFGASGLTDAFLVAYRIPNLLRDLLAEGAFSSAFVPTFTEANQHSHEEGRSLLWELFILLGLITGTLSALTYFFAPELISIFAPSFVADHQKYELTVSLTRIMSPFLFFISMAALFMGALNSLRVFFIPALAPASFNVMSIVCMVVMTSWLVGLGYHPVLSLGWGAILGSVIQAAVQMPLLIKKGYGPLMIKRLGSPRAIKVISLLGPGLIGFAATQINLLINTILATSSAVGATSWLNYAFRLFQMPVGILSVSIGNSNLVHFSAAWKKGDKEEALRSLSSSYYLSFLSVLPAMALLYSLSDEIVKLIFERGRFSFESTAMTAVALRMYVLGLPFYSLYKIWVPTFYAIDRQKVPVLSSLVSILMNIAFCWFMTPIYGFEMLALGTTLSMLMNCTILAFMLRSDLKLSWSFFFTTRLGKLIVASGLMAAVAEILSDKISQLTPGLMGQVVQLTLLSGIALFIFVGALLVMGERDAVNALKKKMSSRFKKR